MQDFKSGTANTRLVYQLQIKRNEAMRKMKYKKEH